MHRPRGLDQRAVVAWRCEQSPRVASDVLRVLLRVAPISLVVTHEYVNPIVAIILGMLLLGERPSPLALAGALLVVVAVYIAVRA